MIVPGVVPPGSPSRTVPTEIAIAISPFLPLIPTFPPSDKAMCRSIPWLILAEPEEPKDQACISRVSSPEVSSLRPSWP